MDEVIHSASAPWRPGMKSSLVPVALLQKDWNTSPSQRGTPVYSAALLLIYSSVFRCFQLAYWLCLVRLHVLPASRLRTSRRWRKLSTLGPSNLIWRSTQGGSEAIQTPRSIHGGPACSEPLRERPARKQRLAARGRCGRTRASRRRPEGGNLGRHSPRLWWRRQLWVCTRLVKRFDPNSTPGEHRC
jgi:hypothetical protein